MLAVWDPSNLKNIKSIEQVQKRATRFVHNNYTDRTAGCVTNMVKSLKWENLENRRKSARLSMLFKIQHDLIDIDRQQYLTPNDSRTRGKKRFYTRKIKHGYLKRRKTKDSDGYMGLSKEY